MKKTLITIAFFVLAVAISAETLPNLILKMPRNVCPILSEYNCLEIVDNQSNNKPMKTKNLLKSTSEMTEMTADYAKLTTTESSEKVFKLLEQSSGSNIILVISTVCCNKVSDSVMEFYDTNWNQLKSTDFIDEPTSSEFREISIDKLTNKLSITTSNPLVLQHDGSDKPVEIVKKEVIWEWNGDKFVRTDS